VLTRAPKSVRYVVAAVLGAAWLGLIVVMLWVMSGGSVAALAFVVVAFVVGALVVAWWVRASRAQGLR
jgi:uncharacterized membrane protein YqjE